MAIDFNYFLNQKYAQLQQQADATTSNAASTAITANANANALALTAPAQANEANAAAGLNQVRTRLAPAESASQIGLQGAQATLLGQQASVVVPEAGARIAQLNAGTSGQLLQNKDFTRTHLTGIFGGDAGVPTLASATAAGTAAPAVGPVTVTGPTGTLPSLTATPTDRKVGESYQDWVNRLSALQKRGFAS